MEDKNLFNKFKDREDLDFEYDDDDDWDDEFDKFEAEDADYYNDGEWHEDTY